MRPIAGTSKQTENDYAKRIIARARQLRESDAFAPAQALRASERYAAVHAQRQESQRSVRFTVIAGIVLVVAVCLMSLCLPYYGVNASGLSNQIYSPDQVLDCYILWFKINVLPLFDSTAASRSGQLLASFNESHDVIYYLVIQRGAVTLVVIACGFLLAVSGMLFQTAFRNPLATPTMLGVSDGVTMGCIVFAFMGYSQAADNMSLYLMLVYGCGGLAVVFVLFASRFIGGSANHNVFDMLLLGTVVCQLLGGVANYITNFAMDINTWERFYNLQQAGDVLNYPQTWIVVAVVFVITLVPVLVLRFRFNLISFPDEEGRMMGARPRLLRGAALVLGSVMQLAALASIGQVAMLSLAVPFLTRYLMPSEFRYQLLGNTILGVIVLLTCIALQHFAVIGVVTVPVGTIIAVFIIPFFIWAVALQGNRWGD